MTQLPAIPPTKEQMVEIAVQWIDRVSEKLKSEYAHDMLRNHIREMLRQGTLPTMAVIDAARKGNPHADIALRKRIAEMLDRDEDMPTSLKAFNQEALFYGPPRRGRGEKNIADLYVRDIGIAIMVDMAIAFWGLKPTRNRASKQPSASTIIALALDRRGFKDLSEWQVEKIHRQHKTLTGRLSATIPIN
jgi:hypothetical protein